MQEVERLLSIADMGPDFDPTPLGADMKTILKVQADRVPDLQAKWSKVAERFIKADAMKEFQSDSAITDDKNKEISDDLVKKPDLDIDLVSQVKAIDNVLRSDLYGIDHKALSKKLNTSRTRPSGSVHEPVVMPTPNLNELKKAMPLISSKRVKKTESKQRVVNREAYEYRLSELQKSQDEVDYDYDDGDQEAFEDLDRRIDRFTENDENDNK